MDIDNLTDEQIEKLAEQRAAAKKAKEKEAAEELKRQQRAKRVAANKAIEKQRCQELFEDKYGFWDPAIILTLKKDKDETIKDVSINTDCATNYQILFNQNKVSIKYNEFNQKRYFNGEPIKDDHIGDFGLGFEKILQKGVNEAKIKTAVVAQANLHKYDPLKEWFEALPAPTTNYIETWLTDIVGAEDCPIVRTIGIKFLVSAVARALVPGSYNEGVLILAGPQAAGKSAVFRTLNPDPSWFSDAQVDISSDQKAAQTYNGTFIVEFAELANIGKAKLEGVKNFLTMTEFNYVDKYANYNKQVGKRMVFGGTTNHESILDDATGSRRFWCVKVGNEINISKLEQIKNDLWAEAKAIYLANCNKINGKDYWVLTNEEREQLDQINEEFKTHNLLARKLKQDLDNEYISEITVDDLHDKAEIYQKNAHPKNITESMQSIGWKKIRVKSGVNRDKVCYVRSKPLPDDFVPSIPNRNQEHPVKPLFPQTDPKVLIENQLQRELQRIKLAQGEN